MTDLKPCPFCGGKPRLLSAGAGNWWVNCEACKVSTNDVGRDRAIELWNERVPLSGGSAPSSGLPEAWQCTDALHPYLLGHITQNRDTIKAWESGGIEYVALVPVSRSRSAATSDTAIAGNTQSDLSIADRRSAKDKAAASTVEPVAYLIHDAEMGDYLSKSRLAAESSEHGFTPLYAAPTGSPEPPFDLAAFQKEAATWETIESEEQDCYPAHAYSQPVVADHATTETSAPEIPDNSNCSKSSNSSAEPDAVRPSVLLEDVISFAMHWQPSESGPSYDEHRKEVDKRLDAALSRPAHGGWEEALRRIRDFPHNKGTCEQMMAQIAGEALARNDRQTGEPRS